LKRENVTCLRNYPYESVLFLVGYAQFGHKTEMRLKNS